MRIFYCQKSYQSLITSTPHMIQKRILIVIGATERRVKPNLMGEAINDLQLLIIQN